MMEGGREGEKVRKDGGGMEEGKTSGKGKRSVMEGGRGK